MISMKKRKLSGAGRLEMQRAYDSLLELQKTFVSEEPDEDPDDTLRENLKKEIKKTILSITSKLLGPHSLSISGNNPYEHMEKLNISPGSVLRLKTEWQSRAAATEDVGKTEYWSSEGLYRHLSMLRELVPDANEAGARLWINAFFFRVAAMSPPGKRMVFSPEKSVPDTTVNPDSYTTLGGSESVHYTVVMASPNLAEHFLMQPVHVMLKRQQHFFFVSQPQTMKTSLESHLPQAVSEMYARAKKLGKVIIRGALTNGQGWIFIVLKMNSDGNGATYTYSAQFSFLTPGSLADLVVSRKLCNMIAGIIAYWIEHSNEDIEANDWFTKN